MLILWSTEFFANVDSIVRNSKCKVWLRVIRISSTLVDIIKIGIVYGNVLFLDLITLTYILVCNSCSSLQLSKVRKSYSSSVDLCIKTFTTSQMLRRLRFTWVIERSAGRPSKSFHDFPRCLPCLQCRKHRVYRCPCCCLSQCQTDFLNLLEFVQPLTCLTVSRLPIYEQATDSSSWHDTLAIFLLTRQPSSNLRNSFWKPIFVL